MKNRKRIVTSNGLIMIECKPLYFQEQAMFKGGKGPKTYTIHVDGKYKKYVCCFDPDKKVLIISNLTNDNPMPVLTFKVKTLEKASELVKSFSDGMEIDLKTSIFTYHTHQKGLYTLLCPDCDSQITIDEEDELEDIDDGEEDPTCIRSNLPRPTMSSSTSYYNDTPS